MSQADPETAAKSLDAGTLPWQVLESTPPAPATDRRPPFRQYVVLVGGYVHLDHGGELILSFFNGRLMKTVFYPERYDSYVGSLRRLRGLMFDAKGETRIAPQTRVWLGTDYRGRRYVGWADSQLEGEFADWIRRYA